jgi:XTP/dITP diphosphohydrolase
MMNQLVLASNNHGKLKEFSALLAPLGIRLLPQAAVGVSEVDEPHVTFVENALAKARHASQLSGLPALADDSGLCVAALAGAPGVLSARFAGEPKSDARNNALLLEKLQGEVNRRAHFVCVLVLVRHAQDPQPLIVAGEWHGEILEAPRGAEGFGYDPLFWVPSQQASAAELNAAVKNQLSHRGVAVRQLLTQLSTELAARQPV